MGESAARWMLAVEYVHDLVERGVDYGKDVLHNNIRLRPVSANDFLQTEKGIPLSKDRKRAAPRFPHFAQARHAPVHARRDVLPNG